MWKPISELPPGVTRAFVFDPDAFSVSGAWGGPEQTWDNRMGLGELNADGTWRVYDEHAQEAIDLKPILFCLAPELPPGFPAVPNFEPLLEDMRAKKARHREAVQRHEAAMAQPHEADKPASELAALEKTYEAYWAAQIADKNIGA